MTLSSNYNNILKKFSHKIYQFGKIRKYLTTPVRILVYKQTILPLVEYVNFMLFLNNGQDVEKLQKLQNRCLRMCFKINNPKDMSVARLHASASLNYLETRREIDLLNIMFVLKHNNQFRRQEQRVTRDIERSVFQTEIVHMDVYAKSPFF